MGGIFPPALELGSGASLGGSSAGSAGSAGGVGLGASSTGLLASFLGETDLMDLLCSCLVVIFPPPVTRALFHQLSMLRRCWGGGVGGSGSGSGSGSALGVGGTEGGSQLWTLANVSSDGSSGSQGGCSIWEMLSHACGSSSSSPWGSNLEYSEKSTDGQSSSLTSAAGIGNSPTKAWCTSSSRSPDAARPATKVCTTDGGG